MTEILLYCPYCDEHVEVTTTGEEPPYCPQCEELLPLDCPADWETALDAIPESDPRLPRRAR
jgi:hypothetical protein